MIEIPKGCLRWLALQRTRSRNPVPEIEEEVNAIIPHLPGKKVLDIGCGIGIASAILAKKGFSVTALDKQATTKRPSYGAGDVSCYNDMKYTQALFDLNGVDVRLVTELPSEHFDAAISFYAWSFHFPLETYSPDASVWIFDVRGNPPDGTTVIWETPKIRRCKKEVI